MVKKNNPNFLNEIIQTLIAENHSITISEISNRSGISRSTLYRKYGSKQNLLTELIKTSGQDGDIKPLVTTAEQILMAITDLSEQTNIFQLTIEEIAKQAEVTPITVYRHFGSKENLVREFLFFINPDIPFNPDLPLTPLDPLKELQNFTYFLLMFLSKNQLFFRTSLTDANFLKNYNINTNNLPKTTRQQIKTYFQKCIHAGFFKQFDVEFLSNSYFGLLAAFTIFSPFFVDKRNTVQDTDFTELAKQITTLFLHGVHQPPIHHQKDTYEP